MKYIDFLMEIYLLSCIFKEKYNPYNLLYGHRSLPEMFNTNFV